MLVEATPGKGAPTIIPAASLAEVEMNFRRERLGLFDAALIKSVVSSNSDLFKSLVLEPNLELSRPAAHKSCHLN